MDEPDKIEQLKRDVVHATSCVDRDALKRARESLDKLCGLARSTNELVEALTDLYALVRGECPAILDETRGGIGTVDMHVEKALDNIAKL